MANNASIEMAKAKARSRARGQPITIEGSTLEQPSIAYEINAPSGDEWYLTAPYEYVPPTQMDEIYGRTTIRIPPGFRFDLASIPRLLWTLIAPFELSIVAPLIHDALFRHGGRPPFAWYSYENDVDEPWKGLRSIEWTRGEADSEFRRLMELEGVGFFRRWSAYLAVRTFGRGSWRENREKVAA